MIRSISTLCLSVLFVACASGPPEVPYPAFVQVDDIEDIFMASLPGVRAKQLAGDPQTRRTSNRIDLPAAWQGTSGGAPGRSMEIFVLEGILMIADIKLPPGGYAFLPAGSLGFNMTTEESARILYFVNDTDPESIIRSPIIIDSALLPWEATVTPGVSTRELRRDPGTGAATWLLKIDAGVSLPWQKSSVLREGYLVNGDQQQSECVNGEALTSQYTKGGYFYRPADAVYGGPQSHSETGAIWLLRETAGGKQEVLQDCVPTS